MNSIAKSIRKKSGSHYRKLKKYATMYENFGRSASAASLTTIAKVIDNSVPVYRCNAG